MKRRYDGPALALALEEIARLEALTADLRRILEGEGPTAADLKDAPFLNGWQHATRPLTCLTGMVEGHPDLGTGRYIRTSVLWSIDPAEGWARTFSRFYRLGKPRYAVEDMYG
ncbi:MAG: hypothetical protein E6Q98_15025 [Rhodospirillaceae bacterium]|nr:MAG: hypothetical protein E6Q98_15025 [Rhodospirillaceae bacterium]